MVTMPTDIMNRLLPPAIATALVGSIVLANYLSSEYGLVTAGFGLLVSAGTYAAGLALGLRDALHEAGGIYWVGAAITPLRRRNWRIAVTASNAVGALVDTLLFLWIAGFPMTAQSVGGQLLVKAVWMTLLALLVGEAIVRSRRSVTV
jgi:hypothetical protein